MARNLNLRIFLEAAKPLHMQPSILKIKSEIGFEAVIDMSLGNVDFSLFLQNSLL